MECNICKLEKELRINNENCKLCGECFVKYDKHSAIKLKNNVLFFMRDHSKKTPYTTIRDKCAVEFSEKEICTAKTYLLDNTKEELEKIDKDEAVKLSVQRQPSQKRTKAVATIYDIHMLLDMLDETINVSAVDIDKIPMINPEKLLPESVVERLEKVEAEINALKTLKY